MKLPISIKINYFIPFLLNYHIFKFIKKKNNNSNNQILFIETNYKH